MPKPFKGKLLITVEANADFDDERQINRVIKENVPFSGIGGGDYRFETTRLVGWKKKPNKRKSK